MSEPRVLKEDPFEMWRRTDNYLNARDSYLPCKSKEQLIELLAESYSTIKELMERFGRFPGVRRDYIAFLLTEIEKQPSDAAISQKESE